MSFETPPDFGRIPADSPHLRVINQYVKELSFRNSMGAAASQIYDVQPAIDIGVEVKSRPIGEKGEAVEVDLCVNVTARRGDMQMFSVNLVYSGLFQFVSLRPDDVEALIWIECPRLLFPFSRQILAEITREGGFPPLLINPIDFTPLYLSELRAREDRGLQAAKDADSELSPQA
jgi:preprotein translocase subunit SecB